MTTSLGWLLIVLAGYFTDNVIGGETCQDPDRLIVCHIESDLHPSTDPCSCTHLVIHNPHDADVIKAAGKLREKNRRLKILTLSQEGKNNPLEDGVSGVYLRLSKSLSKELVIKNVKALATELDDLQASKRANAKYSSENPESATKDVGEIILELPSSPEQLAKNYDLKSLNKYVNYFIISSDNLTDVSEEGLAYHPSRLMGIDDILNTDSLVDLISGLGAEHEKLLVSLPATALQFNLKDPKDNMPRAKVTGPPKSISQKELCSLIENGVWTLERDEDLTAPYAFSDTTWLAFDDSVSASIKAKYILLRGLAGIAVTKSEADDWDHVCASRPILDTIYSTFTNLVRKPRAATLLSLQDQIHNSISPFAGDIQLSPYRIVRVVDRAGSVHVVRKEAKTEFQCSRQGYFTHPSGCNRFYRCVKFNQYSSDFTVFEYDCPAGLAFDERYEVCVWPGSLPDASACKGSSEIAPVPRSRYACTSQGYFADPENCRWFFACLDHHGDGRAPTAYEFRCPFGLVFNEKTLTCDWPWSVPGCGGGSGSVIHTSAIYPGDILEGRLRPAYAQVSDLHVSGGRIADVDGGLVLGTNLLSGISTSGQRYSNGYGYGLVNQINSGYGNNKYVDNSGAYIHDPTGDTGGEYIHEEGSQGPDGTGSLYSAGLGSYGISSSIATGNSGQYVHDSRGDNAGQYVHTEGSQGAGSYSSSGVSDGYYTGGKVLVSGGSGIDNSGAYVHDSRGDNAGQYVHSEGSQGAGSYSSSGASDGYYAGDKVLVSGGSGIDNSGAYVHDSRGDTGGAYVHQDGPAGPGSKPYLHSGSLNIKYGNADGQLNAYEHYGGETEYVHQIGTGIPIYSGIKSSDVSGSSGVQLTANLHQSEINRHQASIGSKTGNVLLSGAYIHDSRGDSGGAYVHQGGSSGAGSVSYFQKEGSLKDHDLVSGVVKTSPLYSTGYIGQQEGSGRFSGGSYGSNSGQYIHDSTGDRGGAYIHQEGPSGTGPVPYIHQEGTNVESDLRGGLKTFNTNYAGPNIVGIGGLTAGSLSSTFNSEQYIHDSRGDTGGVYVHQGGPSYYQGLYAGRYLGQYIHDNSGSYVQGSSGFYHQPYVHQDGPSKPLRPLYQGVNVYNNQYAGQYASKYATDQKQLIHYGSTNIDAAHLYQPEGGVIHTYDNSRLHVQPLGYKESVLRPVPLNPVQYSSHVTNVLPISVTTPSPTVLTGIESHRIQPITVTEKPIIPFNPVQYITPLKGIKTNNLQSLSLIKGSQGVSHSYISPITQTKTISVNPVQYHQETTANTGFSGYGYSKPKVTFSYPENVVKHQYAVQPASATYLTGYSYHPSVPVQTTQVKTVISQPVLKTNVVSPVFVTSTPRPVSVTSSPIVPLNPVQYGTKVETVQVSTPAPPKLVYNPVIKAQTVRPIIVSSTPAVPLSKVQYGTKVQAFVSSTPAPLQVPIHSYNPVITAQTIQPVIVASTPAVPLNPVQYGIKTISSSAGYHYSKPIVGLSYPNGVYSTQAPPVINYTYQKPIVKTQPIQPVVSTPALPDIGISHEIPLHQISISNHQSSFGYTYKQPIKSVAPVSFSTPAPPVVSYSSTPRPIIVSSTPTVPLNPIQYVNPVSINNPPPSTFEYSYNKPLKPLVPVSVHSTSSPPVVSYSYQQPIKPAVNIAVSTPAPPVVSYSYRPVKPAILSYSTTPRPIIVSSTPSIPLNPVQYVNPISTGTPVQPALGYSYQRPIKPVSVSTPARPVVSYSYQQPIKHVPISVSTPAPPVVSYSSTPRPIIVSSTPTVPLNPIQYVNPVSINNLPPSKFGYSYNKPLKPLVPVSVHSTPSPPVVSYSYQQPIKPAVNIAVSTPALPVVSYSYRPVKPVAISTPAPAILSYSTTPRPIIVSSTPSVPLNPVQYVNPALIGNAVQPTFGYSYRKPIKLAVPITVTTPAPPVVSYSSTLRPIQPISVTSTPAIPLNPVQYINPVSHSSPVQQTFGYSYKQPLKPIIPLSVSTSAPPVVSYSYQQPIKTAIPVRVTTSAPSVVSYSTTPAVEFSYQQPVNKPDVYYQTLLKPIAPVNTYSYQNPTTPAPQVIVSTPTPFRSQSRPIQNIKQVTPINIYSYKQTLAPVSVDSPAPSFSYSQPAPFSTSAPAILNYSYNAKGVQTISVSSTPSVPLNPVQYVKHVTTPIPTISYSYKRPFDQSVVNKGPNTVFSYTFDSKPIQPITVSSTPAIPLNPVQYSVTPAPTVTFRPVSTYSTTSVPVINYSYNQPSIKPITNRPLQPAVVATQAPEVSYSYREPDYFLKLKPVRPVSVSSTPVVPLNPVQYVSTTPRPIVNYQYKNPVIKTHTSVVAPSIDYYNEEVLHREITKIKSKPVVGSFYEVPTRTTTLAPTTVSSTPVVPLNPVQYVKQPVFSYTYNSAQPASYNTKGCCSSSSLKVSSTPQPDVLKTTAYPSTIISTKKPVVGAYFEENYEANRQEEGYVYSQPNIKFEEKPLIKNIYSTSLPYNNLPKVTTSAYLQRPVQTYANTVEEESYISNTPDQVTTLVKQPISVDNNDEDLNLHLDISKIRINRPAYTTTSTPQQQIVEVTTVTPVVKRVKVKGGLTRGGYYVRRQKVKVQPVITTTENYPAYFTSTIKPIYSSTIDLSSPTLYSSTVRPSTVYTISSTTLKDDELEVEDEDYDSKLLEQVSGQFGEIINAGNQGIIRQGVSSTTVSSLKDGETIVGVVKKERVAGGRNKAKVVVVSKLSDFNPLLVGKLGAECSCKSNSKTLNLQRGSSGSRGQLFYPKVQIVKVPSREYLPTSSEPPKINDYYLPASEVPFVSVKASTTEAPNSYDDQSFVDIRPINNVRKFYSTTGPALETSSVGYDATTKRSISNSKIGISNGKTLEKGASFDRYGPGGLRGSDETLQGSVDCQRAGLFRHPKYCNKFYACNWDEWKKRFTLHVFNCPIHLAYDSQLGACNWPSKGPACADDNLLV